MMKSTVDSAISKKKGNLILIMIILASAGLAVWFGYCKSGFYIDEDYTYTISNGTQLGIAITPGSWNDTALFKEQLVSEGDENFHFAQMCENTANDVHPPLYYILIHFMSSIFSDTFSKWIGLSVNILILVPTLFFVYKLALILSWDDRASALIITAFYGLSPATMSNVVYIRMYMLLSLLTVIYAYLHVKALNDKKLSLMGFLIPVFITGFCGFLTQYFFAVIMFFVSFTYAFYLLVFGRQAKNAVVYGFTVCMSLLTAVVVWRTSKFHILSGYRGKEAVEQLISMKDIAKRLITYIRYTNKQVFGGVLPLFLIFFIAGNAMIIGRITRLRKSGERSAVSSLPVPVKGMILLEIAAILDYVILVQIGIFAPPESCRFLFQAYSLFLILVPAGTIGVIRKLSVSREKLSRAVLPVSVLFFAVIVCAGFAAKQVLFLYESEKQTLNWIDEHPKVPMMLLLNDNGNYDACIPVFLKYPSIYVASVTDPQTIIDDKIAEADELLVYVSKGIEDVQTSFDSIYKQNPSITTADYMWDSYGWFSVYHMY